MLKSVDVCLTVFTLRWGRSAFVWACFCQLPEKFVRASLLLLVSAMARLKCSRMLLSSDERCSVLCSATRRRSFKAWNSRWYAISFSTRENKTTSKGGCVSRWQQYLHVFPVNNKTLTGAPAVKPYSRKQLNLQQKLRQEHTLPPTAAQST